MRAGGNNHWLSPFQRTHQDAKNKIVLTNKKMMHFCVPFIIYALLAALSLSDVANRTQQALIGHAVMLAILYVLCKYSYTKTAWLLLLWPFVLYVILVVAGVITMTRQSITNF